MKSARIALIIAGLILVLGVATNSIRTYQSVVDTGQQILLELRPVDPRSLIQGDYMSLVYARSVYPPAGLREELPSRGTFIMSVDQYGVSTFSRLDDGTPLSPDELKLRFRRSGQSGDPGLGAESFFFEEGQGRLFADARYGVLRVDERGTSVLVGLADADREIMAPSREE